MRRDFEDFSIFHYSQCLEHCGCSIHNCEISAQVNELIPGSGDNRDRAQKKSHLSQEFQVRQHGKTWQDRKDH